MSDPFKRGEENYAAFLTEDHVRELRQLRVAGSSYRQLAERYGISKEHAWRICQRIAWSWLD
jgi:DNA invertase Pin-like site-specific DNA recombinase